MMLRFVGDLAGRLNVFHRNQSPSGSIRCSDEGIVLTHRSDARLVAWNTITRVVAFKRDLFTGDLVCLAMETDSQTVVELDEGMSGWSDLASAMKNHLPGSIPFDEWYLSVIFPAFKLSAVDVYRRI